MLNFGFLFLIVKLFELWFDNCEIVWTLVWLIGYLFCLVVVSYELDF